MPNLNPHKSTQLENMARMNYFYLKNGDVRGPAYLDDLREMYRRGEIPADTQVCKEGTESWVALLSLGTIETQPPPRQGPPKALPPLASTEYTVVPFVAVVAHGKGAEEAAIQLQGMIRSYSRNGWHYVRLESVETVIQGHNGCFGFGSAPPNRTVLSMVVFER